MNATAPIFRFDANRHDYLDVDTGELLPHITNMLGRTGWIDDRWYTEESSERGECVHRLCTDYDLGALNIDTCVSRYRGYLLAYVKAMRIVRPTWQQIEEPLVHPVQKWGGRPDRVGVLYSAHGLLEIKTGGKEKGHPIQTALQALLVEPEIALPAETLLRYAIYLNDRGRFSIEQHVHRHDFDEARRIIHRCCST